MIGSSSVLALGPEQSLLLLTSLPFLRRHEEDHVRRWVAGALDWDLVLWRAETFGTIPVLYHHLDRLELVSGLPAHVQAYLSKWSILAAVRAGILQDELASIVRALDRNGLEYYVFKGAAVAPLYYPDPSMRHMLDLDVMIRQDDYPSARDIMFEHGYKHGVWLPETNELAEVPNPAVDLMTHHEFPAVQRRITVRNPLGDDNVPASWRRKHLKFAISPTEIAFNVFVDLHFNLAVGLNFEDVWHGVERRTILGHGVPVQSPTDMIWFLAARLYNETFQHNAKKLVMLGDLYAVLLAEGDRIEWSRILKLGEKYLIGPAVFYVLAHLEKLTGVGIPQYVLDGLRPDSTGLGEGNDWGDLIPKLLAVPVVHDLHLAE